LGSHLPIPHPLFTLIKKAMDEFRPQLKKYYYDPTKYKTYLEQLGIQYPTIERKGGANN
jgi:aminobenzoyl-glutamate utilization protein B